MSYQVLARKWRPKNFSQVVGQQHVVTALSNALQQNKVHHAYLFSGTRGVGKTTIARIFAKSLNCIKGVTSEPCGQCERCIAIDEGRFVDLLEIDAASRTKVEDTRELLDNVQYKPAIGPYKVYLIDEVHMLSKSSFNALLKTLEEPPEYVKFLLATTDPQKLPLTVLSRCLQFHLKAIQVQDIEDKLCLILQKEQACFEHRALAVIANAANGSMRDALSLTDQALAFGSGNIAHNDVLKMLGTIDDHHLEYLLHFIVSGNVEKVFAKIEELAFLGADFGKLHQDLAGLCHQIALAQLQQSHKDIAHDNIKMFRVCLSPEEVQLYYQIATQGFKDYAYAPSGKIAFEMTVMRLLAFKPAAHIEFDYPIINQDETLADDDVTQQNIESSQASTQYEHAQVAQQSAENIATQTAVEDPIAAADCEKYQGVVNRSESYNEPFYAPQSSNVDKCHVVPVANDDDDVDSEIQVAVASADKNTAHNIAAKNVPALPDSRNMLRSHREKRNQAKNGLAITDKEEIKLPVSVACKENISHRDSKAVTAPLLFAQENSHDEIKVAPLDLPVLNGDGIDGHLTDNHCANDASDVSCANDASGANDASDVSCANDASDVSCANDASDANDANDASDASGANDESGASDVSCANDVSANQALSDPRSIALNYGVNNEIFPLAKGDKNNLAIPEMAKKNQQTALEAIDTIRDFFPAESFISAATKSTLCVVPEIDMCRYVADKLTDNWGIVITHMQLTGLVKLLAKNCVMDQIDEQIKLTLKPTQKHLLNNPDLGIELEQSLKSHFGQEISLYIEIGTIAGKLTALESEQLIFDQYLDRAKKSLTEDQNIIQLVTSYDAKIYENSIIPL